MQMDLCYSGKQEHNCYIVGINSGAVRGQRIWPLLWSLVVDDLWEINNDG
jgi:hypothetical protein